MTGTARDQLRDPPEGDTFDDARCALDGRPVQASRGCGDDKRRPCSSCSAPRDSHATPAMLIWRAYWAPLELRSARLEAVSWRLRSRPTR